MVVTVEASGLTDFSFACELSVLCTSLFEKSVHHGMCLREVLWRAS